MAEDLVQMIVARGRSVMLPADAGAGRIVPKTFREFQAISLPHAEAERLRKSGAVHEPGSAQPAKHGGFSEGGGGSSINPDGRR